jgi:hypothetical protein
VALRKGFGDAFMFVAVSVSHAKLPLPGIIRPPTAIIAPI